MKGIEPIDKLLKAGAFKDGLRRHLGDHMADQFKAGEWEVFCSKDEKKEILKVKSEDVTPLIVEKAHQEFLDGRRDELDDELRQLKKKQAIAAFKLWITQPFVLQRPPHSIAHKVMEMMQPQLYTTGDDGTLVHSKERPADYCMHSLLIEHDWAALLGGAQTTGPEGTVDEWHLPFPDTLFEFKISGSNVLALASENDSGVQSMNLVFRVGPDQWITDRLGFVIKGDQWSIGYGEAFYTAGEKRINARFDELVSIIVRQIRASAIMLEAEVAYAEPQRAPYRSNQPPKEDKPLPPLSHHIVKLSRNGPRALPRERAPGDPPGRHKRLHFRRGHYRHYATFKTWIKWCLAGDPDLGWVEKEYRL